MKTQNYYQFMKLKVKVKKLHSKEKEDWGIPDNPESRLDVVEQLRLQAGKFLYEYPTRFRRTVKVVRAEDGILWPRCKL